MTPDTPPPLIAVDVGNSRIKFGLFTGKRGKLVLPAPIQAIELPASSFDPASLDDWLAGALADVGTTAQWWIASVNRAPTERLLAWLTMRGAQQFNSSTRNQPENSAAADVGSLGCYRLLKHTDLPLAVPLPQPDRVGVDRLLGAVAANCLRAPDRAAVVIGVGSAITVDLVSPAGEFLGGAILPGIGMSARAMHDFTDLLPLITMEELADPPAALGTTTIDAMRSGLYWGAIGAMKELIARLKKALPDMSRAPDVFITGGAAPVVAQFADPDARCVPHLVLGGIALVAQR